MSKQYTTEYIMTEPSHFSIQYKINPYMSGSVTQTTAEKQWKEIKQTLEAHNASVNVVSPDTMYQNQNFQTQPKDLPDIVFAANYGIFLSEETVILSKMQNIERQGETEYIKRYIKQAHPTVNIVHSPYNFEGCAELYDDSFTETLWGGYGIRSDEKYLDFIADHTENTNIIPLELSSEWFYHLDTCMFVLNESEVLIESTAFTKQSKNKINQHFSTVYECNTKNETGFLPCNSIHLPDGTILTATENKSIFKPLVNNNGIEYIDVSEFEKGGGSIRCMVLPVK